MNKPDGGPAIFVLTSLPDDAPGTFKPIVEPISLRDYFAAQAVCQMAHGEAMRNLLAECNATGADFAAAIAERCYAIADAMLAERSRQ